MSRSPHKKGVEKRKENTVACKGILLHKPVFINQVLSLSFWVVFQYKGFCSCSCVPLPHAIFRLTYLNLVLQSILYKNSLCWAFWTKTCNNKDLATKLCSYSYVLHYIGRRLLSNSSLHFCSIVHIIGK